MVGNDHKVQPGQKVRKYSLVFEEAMKELTSSVCYPGKRRGYTIKSNSGRRGVLFVPTVLELNLQDVGSVGRIFRVLGHQVQVSRSVLLKTQIHSISHTSLSG